MAAWDTTRVKAQLRLTAQRLGQIQDKLDSQGQITRRDIAILLQQGNVALARAKAQKCIHDDIYSDLLQTLEMQVGVILEHAGDLERSTPSSPVVVEAASSIIYAAPYVESKDLQIVRDLLIQRLGPDFARASAGNRDNYVSKRVVSDLSARPPSATNLDRFLLSVAKANGVHWKPDLDSHEKVDAISSMLDAASIPSIDLQRLQALCSQGLPEYPPWIRPKIWRLLLGTLPPHKARWQSESSKQRDNYYDLVRQLIGPFSDLPEPTNPLSPLDAALVHVSKELSHVPRALFASITEEPEEVDQCPLSDNAPDDIKIACARALDNRLRQIRDFESKSGVSTPQEDVPEIHLEAPPPEIRLEETADAPSEASASESAVDGKSDDGAPEGMLDTASVGTPEISLSAPDSPTSTHSGVVTTLVPSRAYSVTGAHPKHESALVRLLYIHFSLNPAHRAPQTASLLVPLYSALVEEVFPEDAAHVEADVFWLFETFVSEFAELDDVESSEVWLKRVGERVTSADTELAEDLQAKGLDPSSPHYTYRWLTTLLTHILPLPAVLMAWDSLFACPPRDKQSIPKLEHLVDICASMLICARGHLFRLGRRPGKPLNLWGETNSSVFSDLLSDRELEEAFIQGMALLQNYPLENIGGMGRVLQLAHDIQKQRESQRPAIVASSTTASGLGARLRNTVWRSTPGPAAVPPPVPPKPAPTPAQDSDTDTDSSDDEEPAPDAQAAQAASNPKRNSLTTSLTSRLATTVWKGITNQSAMEDPPSPASLSPLPSPRLQTFDDQVPTTAQSSTSAPEASASGSSVSAIWGYAEKLRDSDTAAKLAKVSTNWRVKALDAWSNRGSVSQPPHSASAVQTSTSTLSPSWVPSTPSRSADAVSAQKRSSLPIGMEGPDGYTPPPRPAFFRPPRDSMILDPNAMPLASPTGSDVSAHSEGDFERFRRSTVTNANRTPSPRNSMALRSGGPKPLLLNSQSLITHNRSPTLPSNHAMDAQFAEAVRAKRPSIAHRTSQSSISSLSPSDAGRMRTSDTIESRIVPINRARSPIALRERRPGSTSSATSSPIGVERPLSSGFSPATHENPRRQGWRSADIRDSTGTTVSLPSPPVPSSPPEHAGSDDARIVSNERQRGSMVLGEFGELEAPMPPEATPKVSRKGPLSLSKLQIEDSSDSSVVAPLPSRASRVKSKRLPPRLANMRSKDARVSPSGDRATSPNTLAAEWPEETDATTPKASSFEVEAKRTRKNSGEGRTRKISADSSTGRTRKTSNDGSKPRRVRDSAAVEGDDEGYDELLSAYESEDSSVAH